MAIANFCISLPPTSSDNGLAEDPTSQMRYLGCWITPAKIVEMLESVSKIVFTKHAIEVFIPDTDELAIAQRSRSPI